VMFGSVTNPANEHLPDLNAREYATLLPLVVVAFWIGIYPAPLFRVLDQPVHRLVEAVYPGYYSVPVAPPISGSNSPRTIILPPATPGPLPTLASAGAEGR
jgi:NADH-quinone oxidoreductase subunit M